ncbi:hypothetical protein [Flavobacterium eburneipallidum]|uniref:hypothetical protein n=1 Tax=Flavobacterium eburneipallidum TaxID=3003263 RepID=UPI0022AC2698|nr:hypothetical protein [Flavobacterium eburneipallidum]
MKTSLKLLTTTLTFILLSITNVSAQYGNGYGGGYGGNGYGGYGGGMNQMGSTMNQSQPEKPKEIPVEVTAAKIVEDMKPALNLDELQVIAITNVIKESLKAQGVLMKQEYPQEEQMNNFKALAETTDQKINQFLNKDQKEKYIIFKENRKTQKKTKEKSKSKDKSKEKEKQD